MAERTPAQLKRNEEKTLALVNTIREATGRKPIKRLQKAFPTDSQACAIAKPLKVVKSIVGVAEHSPNETEKAWDEKYATFTFVDEEIARKVAKAINQPYRCHEASMYHDGLAVWDVRLPVYASQFIEDFDDFRYPHLVDSKTGGSSAFGA